MFRGEMNGRSKFFKVCKECDQRYEGCHGDCEAYAKEVILGAILEADDKKTNAKRDDEYIVHEKRAKRIASSCPGAKKAMRKSGYIRNRRG